MTVHYSPSALRSARKDKGWSQRRLAAEIRQSPGAVSKYERVTEPPLSVAAKICRALGLELTDLLTELDPGDGPRPA